MQAKYYESSPVNQPHVKNVFAVDEERNVIGMGGSEESALKDLLSKASEYADSKAH